MAKAKTDSKKDTTPKSTEKKTKVIRKETPEPKKSLKGKADPLPALNKARSQKKESAKSGENRLLELCLLLDCTGSMASWIQRSKDTLKEIIDSVTAGNPGLEVRVCFVGYRDIRDNPRFSIHEFTDDLEKIKKFISAVNANGGGDFPEDVQGGFHKALGMDWSANSIKQAFHIFDAPGHGKDICPHGDDYPKGSPDGHKI